MKARATALVVVAIGALVVSALPARGGGGACTGSLPFTDKRATIVEMEKSCFAPTVTRVGRGETVTIVNRDLEVHNVSGANGTFGDIHGEVWPGEKVSFTFDEDGVFPYLCIFHPGMAGAIVVGDGAGKVSSAAGIASASFNDPSQSKRTNPTSDSSGDGIPAVMVAAAALVVVAAGAFVRFRARSAAAPVPGVSTPRR